MLGSGATYFALRSASTASPDLQRDGGVGDINGNGTPSFDQADGAAGGRLRADMADGSTAGCAGEAAIRDEATVLSSFMPASAEVGLSISRMPGPPFGALVADDHYVAGGGCHLRR